MPTEGSERTNGGLRTAILIAGVIAGLVASPIPAFARDSDGTRLGAQLQEVGTTQKDKLNPPEDRHDWRYVKIQNSRVVRLSLESEPTDKVVTLRLTKATGDEIDSKETQEGKTRIERNLEPGLYYVDVTSAAKVSYSLSVE